MSEIVERTFAGVTVRILRDVCIGSGNCVHVAPEVFELDETSIVSFREDAAEIAPERLEEACHVCPVQALAADRLRT